MNINEYQSKAMRTANRNGLNIHLENDEALLLNGLMGLNGESGEALDLMKKYMFQGHDLDTNHIAKELGDVCWYLAVAAYALGYPLETVMQMNIDKLQARYPNGFDAERSLHRKEGDI